MPGEPAETPLQPCPFCGADHGETVLRCPETDMVLPFQGRLLAGKFRFLAELGRGGMGAVWRACNVHVGRDVAIKLILPEVPKNPEIVARFRDEARVAARIGHPGICDILDFEQTPIGPVIVMELLRGENLAQRIAREGPLPVPVAVGVVRQALAALEAAHRAGVIHRDLKPENLFIHRPDAGVTTVKLMDFGISKFIDRTGALTGSGAILGTPEYMAPEQIGGAAHADARTDVWAVGAVLYKALTGADAFAGGNVVATLLAVTSAAPAPLESHVASLPPELSAVVLRCLARDPAERFQTARELADALRPFEAELPHGARLRERDSIGSLPTMPLPVAAARPTVLSVEPSTVPIPSREPAPRSRRLVALGLLGACALAGWWFVSRDPGDAVAVATPPADDPPADLALEPGDPAPADASRPASDPGATAAADASRTSAGDASAASVPAVTSRGDPPLAPADTTGTPADTGAVADGATPEASDGTKPPDAATAGEPPAKDPPPLISAGEYVTPSVAGKPGNQHWAREYCEALDRNKYLGIDRWKLANPREAKLFTNVTGVKPGGYWTTANHRGVGLVVWLPRGSDSSVRASKKVARPLCVAPRS